MKKITILGSAAAEGIPSIFCNCRVCRHAWEHGGKDMRMRTAYKINDHVRIDFGPDTMAQEYKYNLHSEELKHVFITHSHEDHFDTHYFFYRRPGFAVVDEDNIINLYGNVGVMNKLYNDFARFRCDFKFYRMNPVEIFAFQEIELPGEDMTFYPLKANHMTSEEPHFYVFRWGDKWVMIANDTGFFCDEDWAFLAAKNIHFDLVITDCTGGKYDGRDGHMSGKWVLETKRRLEEMGCVDGATKYYINHFSHNGHLTHEEFEAHYNPHGIQVCYDGLEIEL